MQDTKDSVFFRPEWCRQIHLELSTLCNAACPQCPRFHANSPIVRKNLTQTSVSLAQIQQWFPRSIVENLTEVMLCGTHGDPMMAPEVLEITEYFLEANPELDLIIHTNGGMRTPEFWREFGQLMAGYKNARVMFGIDGLEDTNHRYRRRVVWSRLMANIKAYTESGARAQWVFTEFLHNYDQIDQARELSVALGMEYFMTRPSWGLGTDSEPQSMPVRTTEGRIIEWLDRPQLSSEPLRPLPPFQPSEPRPRRARKHPGGSAPIKCRASTAPEQRQIYISVSGEVMPCCYWATEWASEFDQPRAQDTRARYGPVRDQLCLGDRSLRDILESEILDRITADQWNRDCARTCRDVCGS